jgi:hypothetical protein
MLLRKLTASPQECSLGSDLTSEQTALGAVGHADKTFRSTRMTRYLISAAAILLMSASPVLAADTMKPSSQPAGENAAGGDTSSGAKEQSSAPPGSPAESDLSNKSSTGTGEDTSGGAMERSSAPPGSSAAEPSKPNPTLNTNQQDQTQKPGQ